MKLSELLDQYGEWEWVSTQVPEKGEADVAMIQIKKPKPKTNTVWGLEDGESHYWVDGVGEVKECDIWRNNSYDPMAREVGNIFLTREDAEKDVERRKVETLLLKYGGRRWFKKDDSNYYMRVNTHGSLIISCTAVGMQGLIYFDTIGQAKKAMAEIGEQRIKETLFEVR